MQRARTPVSRRITWAPGWRLRVVLLAAVFGSVCGLVFGLSSLNRPILNAAVFYVLGGAVAALVAGVVVLLRSRRAGSSGDRRSVSGAFKKQQLHRERAQAAPDASDPAPATEPQPPAAAPAPAQHPATVEEPQPSSTDGIVSAETLHPTTAATDSTSGTPSTSS